MRVCEFVVPASFPQEADDLIVGSVVGRLAASLVRCVTCASEFQLHNGGGARARAIEEMCACVGADLAVRETRGVSVRHTGPVRGMLILFSAYLSRLSVFCFEHTEAFLFLHNKPVAVLLGCLYQVRVSSPFHPKRK